MDNRQKEFYANLEATFLTPGWDLIKRGWQEEQQQLAEVAFFNAKSMEDVEALRVRYGLLNELISLPETIEQQKLNLINEVDDE
jgi:hypothetical protein